MFLYYARAVDPCILPEVNGILYQHANPMQATNDKVSMLMDYDHSYHDAVINYYVRNLQLHIDSDAAYLILPKARSWGAGHLYLSNKIGNTLHSLSHPQCSHLNRMRYPPQHHVVRSESRS